MRWMILIGVLVLAGCGPSMIQGNEQSVAYENTFDRAKTSQAAEAHCQQYGKTAKLTDVHDFFMTFECVE
jgi:hypothetical protein